MTDSTLILLRIVSAERAQLLVLAKEISEGSFRNLDAKIMTAVYATVHTIDNFQINIWRVLFKCMEEYAKSVASSFLPRPASLIAGQERLWRQRAPCSSSTSCQRKKSSNAQDFEPLRRIAFNRTKFDGRRMAEQRRKWSSFTRTSSRKINC